MEQTFKQRLLANVGELSKWWQGTLPGRVTTPIVKFLWTWIISPILGALVWLIKLMILTAWLWYLSCVTVLGTGILLGIANDQNYHRLGLASNEEGFWSPPHYLMIVMLLLFDLLIWVPAGRGWFKEVPNKHELSYLGWFKAKLRNVWDAVVPGFHVTFVGTFIALGGFFLDMAMHSYHGVEIGTAASVSPSHGIMMVGLVLMLIGSFYATCVRLEPGTRWSWIRNLPAILSLAQTYMFFWMIDWPGDSFTFNYRWHTLEAFVKWGWVLKEDVINYILAHDFDGVKMYSFQPAYMAVQVTSAVLTTLLMTAWRRFIFPVGVWTLLIIAQVTLHSIMYVQVPRLFPVAMLIAVMIEAMVLFSGFRYGFWRSMLVAVGVPFLAHSILSIASVAGGSWWPVWVDMGMPVVGSALTTWLLFSLWESKGTKPMPAEFWRAKRDAQKKQVT